MTGVDPAQRAVARADRLDHGGPGIAALALLRLVRKSPPDQLLVSPDTFSPVMTALLEEWDMGLLLASASLFLGLLSRQGAGGCCSK